MSSDQRPLTPDEDALLNKFLEAAPYRDIGVLEGLTSSEREVFLDLLRALREGEDLPIGWMWELDYTEKPVDPYTFLTDSYFYGDQFQYLWEGWIPELLYVLNPDNRIREWIVTGCIGSGKSSNSVLSMVYKIYILSILRQPQSFYGLHPDSMICLGMFNTTLDKTDLTLHYKFQNLLYSIPYFRDRFPVIKSQSPKRVDDYQIVLPKHIRLISGSNAMHALSMDLYGGILDEQNFREGAKIQPYEETRAYNLYRQTMKRIESRFPGDAPCLLINVSSSNTQSDFTVEHIERVESDPRTHVTRFSLWDVRPHRYVGQRRFKVVVGTKYESSRILGDNEEEPTGRRVIEVPEEHRRSFETDIEHSLRDLAGVDIVGKGSLIPSREKIRAAADAGIAQGLSHPFTLETVSLSTEGSLELTDVFLPNSLLEFVGRTRRPIRHPDCPRFLHVDLAVSGDSAGIAMGHVASTSSVIRLDVTSGKRVTKYMPVIEIDFMLQIPPPKAGQIDFERIIDFVIYLRNALGISIKRVTYDGYQSVHSIQLLKKNGFNAEVESVDKKDDAYLALRQAIMEDRFVCYEYDPFSNELAFLVHDLKRNKVDHLKGRSKDVSDAVAGVTWSCIKEASSPTAMSTPMPKEVTRSTNRRRIDKLAGLGGKWQIADYKPEGDKRILEISKRKSPIG